MRLGGPPCPTQGHSAFLQDALSRHVHERVGSTGPYWGLSDLSVGLLRVAPQVSGSIDLGEGLGIFIT